MGPLIGVIGRMIKHLLSFIILLVVIGFAWTVAMHAMLRDEGDNYVAYVHTERSLEYPYSSFDWPEAYSTMASTTMTLFRAHVGDFNLDFSGSQNEFHAEYMLCL